MLRKETRGHYARTFLNFNDNYFENIDNEEKAYFLGLIYADGNVSASTDTCKIGLLQSDSDVLIELGKRMMDKNYSYDNLASNLLPSR